MSKTTVLRICLLLVMILVPFGILVGKQGQLPDCTPFTDWDAYARLISSIVLSGLGYLVGISYAKDKNEK